jgi:accessory gene regulator protein AgrB
MITKMLILVLCWLVGYAISALLSWYTSKDGFSVKDLLPQMILSVVIGIVASFFVAKIDLNDWIVWAAFIFFGFISETIIKFIAKKAKQINGE